MNSITNNTFSQVLRASAILVMFVTGLFASQLPAAAQTATTTSNGQAQLQVTLTAPANVTKGQTITFSAAVKNTGTATANNVVVTHGVTGDLIYLDSQSSSACALQANTVNDTICTIASIAAGQTVTVVTKFTIGTNVACFANIANRVAAKANGIPQVLSNQTTTYINCPTAGCDAERDLRGELFGESSGRVTNLSNECTYNIGLAVYKMYDLDINHQTLFDSETMTIGPNQVKVLNVDLPSNPLCAYQIDLFYGSLITSFADGARYGDRILAAEQRTDCPFCIPPQFPTIPAPTVSTTCPATGGPKFTVNWTTASQGAQGYRVEIDNDNNWNNGGYRVTIPAGTTTFTGPNASNVLTGFGATTGTLTQLENNHTYKVRVYYVQSNKYSPTVSFTTNCNTCPGDCVPAIPAPHHLTTFCDANQKPQFRVQWDHATQGTQGYRVQVDTDNNWANGGYQTGIIPSATHWYEGPNTPSTMSQLTGFGGVTGTLTQLNENTTYYVRVFYVQSGKYSPTVSFKTPDCTPTFPTIPTPTVAATCVQNTPRFTVNWTAASQGAQGYRVEVDTDNNWNNGGYRVNVAAGTTSFTAPSASLVGFGSTTGALTSLNENTTYKVRVYYVQSGAYSATATVTTGDCTPTTYPNIPNPTATATCVQNAPRIAINWTAASQGAQGYRVEVDNDNNWANGGYRVSVGSTTTSFTAPSAQLVGFGGTTGTLASLNENATYRVRIFYVQSNTNSATVNVTTGDCTPTIPTLNASCTATPSVVQTNQNVTWLSQVSGGNGTASYTYLWTGTDGLSSASSTVVKSYATAGTKNAQLVVMSGSQTRTVNCSVVVNNPPVTETFGLTCAANPTTINVNQSTTWMAIGTNVPASTITYSWTGSDSLTATSSSVTKTYTSAGTKTATVTAVSAGQTRTAECSIVVNERTEVPPVSTATFYATCTASPANPSIGQLVTFNAIAYGNPNGTYNYSWSGDESLSGSGTSITKTYTSGGTKNVTVTVTSQFLNGTTRTTTANCPVNLGGVSISTFPNQVAGVFLSQVPYTGLRENWMAGLFLFALLGVTGYAAYAFLKRRYAYETSVSAQQQAIASAAAMEQAKRAQFDNALTEVARSRGASISADLAQALTRTSNGNVDWAKAALSQIIAATDSQGEWKLVTLESAKKIYPHLS